MSNREQVVLNGRYELQRRVGRGGMAEVFLAHDRLLDRPVAIKILFPEFATDPSFVARFRREAQSAANLNHPNITGVYDWGKERGTYYIVMEYVDGQSVSDILRAEGPLEAKRAASIAAAVAGALGFAHRNGVVHRDVKPGNVIITTTGEVKVADFGIARALTSSGEENLTQTGSVMGTATYFSPEQAQGHPADPRSDLYSLGVVLYEMVAGGPPFTADSPVAIAYKHVQESVPSLRERAPGVPEAYEAVTLKALAKDVDARYQDADELRADLLRFGDGRPVMAAAAPAAPSPDAGDGEGANDPPTQATTAVAGAGAAVPPDGGSTSDVAAGDDGEEPPAPSRTGWFFVAIVVLLAVLGGLLFVFANQMGIFDSQTVEVEVPKVVGLPEKTATRQLKDLEFTVGTVETVASKEDVGEVVNQDPSAGTKAKEGATVMLQVSGGPVTKPFPQLTGETEKEAKDKLDADGFTGKVSLRKRADPDRVGTVIETRPPAGTDQPLDVEVRLVLGVAPATTTPPPTTLPPTTLPPTTSPPTTLPPTTSPPTTLPPTTSPPTTLPPTTTTTAPPTTTTTTTTAPPTTTTTTTTTP